MKRFIIFPLLLTLVVAGSVSCTKKDTPAEAEKAEEKGEANVVTLTKENLAHVKIATQPVVRGNLQITLKAAGRVSANLNKTAKVFTTLEGRLNKLTFDLSDTVKRGDLMASVETPELLGKPLELKAPIDGVVTERKSTVGELINKETAIYTISGRAVRVLKRFSGLGQVQVSWDGRDDEGDPLANGTYLFKVYANGREPDGASSSREKASADGRFVIINR